MKRALLALCGALLLCGSTRTPPMASGLSRIVFAQQEEPSSPRSRTPLTILQINDVYSTIPIDGAGGLARVATLKQQLVAAGRTPLLIIAGDFLSPSVASSVFKGEQMVAALNAAGLDLATLGNHEFDFGTDVLVQRMRESRWQWVISNVVDTHTGRPLGGAAPYVVRNVGPLKIGFIGLCLTTSEIARDKLQHVRLVDPLQAARTYLPTLKRKGTNVIVAITHLRFAEDRALAARFPEIDLILGGHEHYPITVTKGRTLISKAGSDARWVARIDVDRSPAGIVGRFFELIPVTAAIQEDRLTAEVVKSYEDRLGSELDTVIGATNSPLDAVSARLRVRETNLGDLVADAIRADARTDISIINAGSIRGDRIHPVGPLTRRTIVDMHPFGNVICTLAVPGRIVLAALNSGVSKLPAAAGQFPLVSGLRLRVDRNAAPGDRVRDVLVNGAPLDLRKTYTVAISDFMLKGGDGYDVFTGQKVLIGPEAGDLMTAALEKYIASRKEIAPATDGRITILPARP